VKKKKHTNYCVEEVISCKRKGAPKVTGFTYRQAVIAYSQRQGYWTPVTKVNARALSGALNGLKKAYCRESELVLEVPAKVIRNGQMVRAPTRLKD